MVTDCGLARMPVAKSPWGNDASASVAIVLMPRAKSPSSSIISCACIVVFLLMGLVVVIEGLVTRAASDRSAAVELLWVAIESIAVHGLVDAVPKPRTHSSAASSGA
jgi:hypothetical protein